MTRPIYDLPRPDDPKWLADHPEATSYVCSECGGRTTHIDRWDAYACLPCNRWQEPACTDPKCTFCVGRPSNPTPVTKSFDLSPNTL